MTHPAHPSRGWLDLNPERALLPIPRQSPSCPLMPRNGSSSYCFRPKIRPRAWYPSGDRGDVRRGNSDGVAPVRQAAHAWARGQERSFENQAVRLIGIGLSAWSTQASAQMDLSSAEAGK
jgi:hypothetical protein